MMALRVNEMNDEWSARRNECLNSLESDAGLTTLGIAGRTMGRGLTSSSEKGSNPTVGEPGLGVYEPHTHSILCWSYFVAHCIHLTKHRPYVHPTYEMRLGNCFFVSTVIYCYSIQKRPRPGRH